MFFAMGQFTITSVFEIKYMLGSWGIFSGATAEQTMLRSLNSTVLIY